MGVGGLAFGSAAKWCHHYSPRLPFAAAGCHTSLPVNRLLTTMTATNPGPKVCTLDCTGTIMRIKGALPRLYLGVLEDHLGVEEGAIPGVSEPALVKSFGASLKKRSREVPCFGSGVMSSEEWWADVVRATFRGAGVAEENLDGPVFDDVFEKLFHDVFTSEPAWELVPGAEDVIADLRAWCQEDGGPRALGVISNFDERLHPLLKNLGVHDSFDFVLTSRECGSEKPDPDMFQEALKRAGASGYADTGLHVGDNFNKDVLGAHAAGWGSVLITDGDGLSEEERDVEHIRVRGLVDVPEVLGVGRRNQRQRVSLNNLGR